MLRSDHKSGLKMDLNGALPEQKKNTLEILNSFGMESEKSSHLNKGKIYVKGFFTAVIYLKFK